MPNSILQEIATKLSRSFRMRQTERIFNSLLLQELQPLLRNFRPTLFFFMKGYKLSNENNAILSQTGVPIVLWTIDSLSRFPGQGSIGEIASLKCIMDGGELHDDRSIWLPLGYNGDMYGPENRIKDIDVLFIGYLKRPFYAKRRAFLKELSDSALPDKYKCSFIGTTGNRVEDWLLRRRLRLDFIGALLPKQYAAFVKRAKVCINIHQDDGIRPVNPMFFNITGAGICQVVDNREYFSEWLDPWEHYVPLRKEELGDGVAALLSNEQLRDSISRNGGNAVRSRHTYERRLADILARLELTS